MKKENRTNKILKLLKLGIPISALLLSSCDKESFNDSPFILGMAPHFIDESDNNSVQASDLSDDTKKKKK